MTDTYQPEPVSESEWTPSERAYRLRMLLERTPDGLTTNEIKEALGYGSYSAAISMMERSRFPDVWRDDETGRWRLIQPDEF